MTAQVRTAHQVAHDALEDLEIAKRHFNQLEAMLCAANTIHGTAEHVRNLVDAAWSLACNAANLASCNCEEIGLELIACAPQIADAENVARNAEEAQS